MQILFVESTYGKALPMINPSRIGLITGIDFYLFFVIFGERISNMAEKEYDNA
jgi:hypothetical protein